MALSSAKWSLLLLAQITFLFTLTCCSYHAPPTQVSERALEYTDADFAAVLTTYRDEAGRIDYQALSANPKSLGRYYQRVAAISPDQNPEHFATENEKLAYWINAYNATVMWNVVQHYPIESVRDVPSFSLPRPAGFFLNQKFSYGGKKLSLYSLERQLILKRFDDPRVHFALNCASLGCPILPALPLRPATLDQELDREARRFINDPRFVRIGEKGVHLSSIFKWYRSDFTDWLEEEHPELEPNLLSYVRLYSSEKQKRELQALGDNPKLQFIPYDWTLNDRL